MNPDSFVHVGAASRQGLCELSVRDGEQWQHVMYGKQPWLDSVAGLIRRAIRAAVESSEQFHRTGKSPFDPPKETP